MESAALFAAMLLMLLGPEFSFQVVKTFLSFITLHAPALEIVMDSVIIQNTMVLRVRDENEPLITDSLKMLASGKQGRVPLALFCFSDLHPPAPVLMHCMNYF